MKFLQTWQALAWTIFFVITILFLAGQMPISGIKAGSFEVSLENRARELGILNTAEFSNLKTLNEDELKLFLIMGGEEAAYYHFTNFATTADASNRKYIKLQEASLMRIQIVNDTARVTSTEIGRKVHRALIQSIYSQLIK